jgi:hypothetical protein
MILNYIDLILIEFQKSRIREIEVKFQQEILGKTNRLLSFHYKNFICYA